MTTEAQLMCVLCGLIVLVYYDEDGGGASDSWPSACALNAGGPHISPDSPAAEQALEIRRKWLNP